MLKYQINRNNIFSDQLRIHYTSFSVEDIDYIDETKCLVTCFYDNDIDIKENDYVVAVYNEPTMDGFNNITTKNKFREYKVEGVDTDERFFTLVTDKYCELKGTYLSNEVVVTYEDKIIDSVEYESLTDEEKTNYTIYMYSFRDASNINSPIGDNKVITKSVWDSLGERNSFEQDAYVDCYKNGNEYVSIWERYGGNEYKIDEDGNVIETIDPYADYGETPDSTHKIFSPYTEEFVDQEAYDLMSVNERECYVPYTYIYPNGETVETNYLYVWFANLHYFKETDTYPPEIEIDCDDITYTLTDGEIVNGYGLRFLQNVTTDAVYYFFKNENLYPLTKYIEPVEGTELEPLDFEVTENVDYFIARIDEAKIRRRDIVFPPPPKSTDENEYEPTTSDDTNVALYLKKYLTSISIPMSKAFSTDMYHEYNVKENFVDVETKKAINDYVEMEKDVYHPVVIDGMTYKDIKEIRFNLHFREHRGDGWVAEPESFWNGTYLDGNTLKLMNPSNNKKYGFFGYYENDKEKSKQSDLLTYLNFTNNDVKFQKNVLKKSFLRLSFYDSPRQSDQNLLNYSTIFMDSGSLFGKFTRNFLKPADKNKFYYSRLVPGEEETKLGLSGIRTDREVYSNTTDSIEEYRLSSQFVVKDKYSSLASSEGFYLYLWKDNDLGITPSDIYLKVEFNHAGYGRTIPFMMPFKDNGGIKTFSEIVNDWNGDGYGIRKYIKYSYIHFKYCYDKVNERHVYYLDPEQYGSVTLEKDNVLNINLWEAKVV